VVRAAERVPRLARLEADPVPAESTARSALLAKSATGVAFSDLEYALYAAIIGRTTKQAADQVRDRSALHPTDLADSTTRSRPARPRSTFRP